MRDRGIYKEFLGFLKALNDSSHPMAPVAVVGLCQGLFHKGMDDGLEPFQKSDDFKILEDYMNSPMTTADFIDWRDRDQLESS